MLGSNKQHKPIQQSCVSPQVILTLAKGHERMSLWDILRFRTILLLFFLLQKLPHGTRSYENPQEKPFLIILPSSSKKSNVSLVAMWVLTSLCKQWIVVTVTSQLDSDVNVLQASGLPPKSREAASVSDCSSYIKLFLNALWDGRIPLSHATSSVLRRSNTR